MITTVTQAGLFSAVVTAFAAGSYQSLQPDDQGTSVQILFRISQQLSSLAVTPGFVNSTVESAVLPPFTPEPLAVQVNTFWFLSLALSLVAALFAIVVQQWLREYPVSGLRTVRECLRLRHFRYTNLNAWAVPHIVSILPILLQVALVLFLVGLAEFLWTLNHTVAWPFIVFLAVSVGFLLFTTLIPSMSASCPYKSPLAEIIILAVRSLVHASSLAIKAAASVVLTLAILSITGLIQVQHLVRLSSSYLDYRRQGLLNRLTRILIPSTWPFTLSQSTKRVFSEYWTTCDEDVVRDKEGLDQDILIWAPSALPSNQWSQIHPCLQDRTRDEVIECVTQLVTQSFNVSGQTSPSALRYPATLALRHMDRVSVEQCREYLFGAFLNTEQDGGSAVTRPPVSARLEVDSHLVLYFLMCAQPRPNSAMRVSYIQMLFDTRKELRALGSNDSMYAHSRLRIVTSALLECSTAWEHVFSLEGELGSCDYNHSLWVLTLTSCRYNGDVLMGLRRMDPRAAWARPILGRPSMRGRVLRHDGARAVRHGAALLAAHALARGARLLPGPAALPGHLRVDERAPAARAGRRERARHVRERRVHGRGVCVGVPLARCARV